MSVHPLVNVFSAFLMALLTMGCFFPRPARWKHRSYPATLAEGRTAVQEVMKETQASAVSVTLMEGDRVLWSEAFGWADQATSKVATPKLLFGAASVSKMLAAASVMLLVDQGKLKLDEPVVSYLPG